MIGSRLRVAALGMIVIVIADIVCGKGACVPFQTSVEFSPLFCHGLSVDQIEKLLRGIEYVDAFFVDVPPWPRDRAVLSARSHDE